MKIDELILELKNIRENQGNVDIFIYDKNKEKAYSIEGLENGNFKIDTSTKLEKFVYEFVDKHNIESISKVSEFLIRVDLKDGGYKNIIL